MHTHSTDTTAAQGQNVRKPTDFAIGAKVRNIYDGQVKTVSKSYWQNYEGGNSSDYTIEFAEGGWNKSTNLELAEKAASIEHPADLVSQEWSRDKNLVCRNGRGAFLCWSESDAQSAIDIITKYNTVEKSSLSPK